MSGGRAGYLFAPMACLALAGCASGDADAHAQAVRESRSWEAREASGGGEQAAPVPGGERVAEVLEGRASYYADSLAGNRTASGERYDPKALTAAHRDLPFGTRVRVVRQDNRKSVVVRINDRGPFGKRARIIDLSRAAAEQIDMVRAGVVQVRVEVLAGP
jgi:rare lipoprotein A